MAVAFLLLRDVFGPEGAEIKGLGVGGREVSGVTIGVASVDVAVLPVTRLIGFRNLGWGGGGAASLSELDGGVRSAAWSLCIAYSSDPSNSFIC